MKDQLVTFDFQSHAIAFTEDGFTNLTEMCAPYGKKPHEFQRLDSTQRFMVELAADTGLSLESKCGDSPHLKGLLITVRGQHNSGTWAHPDLALECARWLSPKFAIWMNRTIRKLLNGECLHGAQDVRALARLECRMKEMQEDLRQMRRRMTSLTHVEGNVSMWAYLKAAGIPLQKLNSMRAARAASRLCQAEALPIGTVKQRTNNQGNNNTNKTFPPSVIYRVLTALGLNHTEPPLSTIMNAWKPYLNLV